LRVPVCVQIGASLDFVAGRVRRAPRHLQRLGLEWAYRMWLEPARLAPRYARNALFLLSMVARDLIRSIGESFSKHCAHPLLRYQPAQGSSSLRDDKDTGLRVDSSVRDS